MQSTQFLWDYQPSQDHRSSSTTEQIAASSPPQKGLPSTLEAAPESVQSPINEQPLELPEVQYIPIEIPDIELPPAPPAPTNAPVEVPMTTFTQEDIDQRIAVALAAYQSQQSTANRPLRLNIPAPEPFSGKAEDLRRFIQCVLSYFVATNNTRLSDEAKIAFTVALMRKDLGKTWADAYYEKSAGGVQVYSTWANFVAALEEAFPEHGTRIKAHQILMKLPERQKDRKTALSLGNYVTRFEQLASKAQLKDAEVNGTNRVENDYHTLHANFVKGLPKELYFALATRVARDRPNTMKACRYIPTRTNMSSTLPFLDQFNTPSTEGGKRISIYTPKHTHVGDSTLLTLLLSNPTDIFNKLKTHNPEATNATDRTALEAYLSARHEYDKAVKAADEAIDHHKRLLRQQDDRVLTELIRLDNLKVAHHFQPLLPRSIWAQHNKFIPRAIPNAYLPLPAPLPTSAFRRPPIPSPFLQAMPRSTTIPADWQPNPGWTPKGSCRRCGSSRHWRHVSAPPEEPARRMGVVVDNVFLEGIINEAKERRERERQTKAVPIPPPRSTNPEPLASPIAGSSCPRPDTPVVFRKVNPDWTPDTTQWTWDSSWPRQEHLSGKEWKNVGRNTCNEWFDEQEDDGVDWELYGDGEHLHNGVRAHFVPGIVPLRFLLY
ncbi:predicted protein [Postia placenta Mad-698-R]|nr:predicted protein [Postia placenta Mad-698-R]